LVTAAFVLFGVPERLIHFAVRDDFAYMNEQHSIAIRAKHLDERDEQVEKLTKIAEERKASDKDWDAIQQLALDNAKETGDLTRRALQLTEDMTPKFWSWYLGWSAFIGVAFAAVCGVVSYFHRTSNPFGWSKHGPP